MAEYATDEEKSVYFDQWALAVIRKNIQKSLCTAMAANRVYDPSFATQGAKTGVRLSIPQRLREKYLNG